MNKKLKAIITGTTGMVGEGILHECLMHPQVDTVLVINRKSCGIHHPKMIEIIHENFFDFTPIQDKLTGYNACFFCLGVTSLGKKEPEYTKLTHTLTLHIAEILSKQNPKMTFCYISGAGTDSTEKGRSMWARVKGKTENDLMKLPFKRVFAFRPGYIHPTDGLKNTQSYYSYLSWLFPIFQTFFQNYVSTLTQVGLAMINATLNGYSKNILEVKDINELAGI